MAPVLARPAPPTQLATVLVGGTMLMGLAMGLVMGCRPRLPATDGGAPVIVAADGVLCDLTRTLVQSAATVVCLVPPGEDPHGLRLTPEQRQQLARASRVYITGYGLTPQLANWPGARPVAELAVPQSPFLDPGRQVHDPHVWHDPKQSQAMVEWLAQDLATALPLQAAAIARRAHTMEELLGDLDQWNRIQLATIPAGPSGQRPVLASGHRGFASLARAYGLRELALVDGMSSSLSLRPQSVSLALQWLQQQHVRQLFSETIPPARALQRLSTLSGIAIAPQAVVVDGLAQADPSLPATAIANTCVISEGLGGRCDQKAAQGIAIRWRAIR